MTEPIDQATKDLIEKEAEEYGYDIPSAVQGYVRGATVWAGKLKQKDELLQSIRHKLYSRDTDDAIIHELDELLTEGGYPYENED